MIACTTIPSSQPRKVHRVHLAHLPAEPLTKSSQIPISNPISTPQHSESEGVTDRSMPNLTRHNRPAKLTP
jgi:hypothetical protein